jgi:hypothetical protein
MRWLGRSVAYASDQQTEVLLMAATAEAFQ